MKARSARGGGRAEGKKQQTFPNGRGALSLRLAQVALNERERERLTMNYLEPTIKRHSFFHDMKPQYVAVVAKGASEASFKPGEFLIHEEEPANRFFLIVSGKVTVEAHEQGAVSVEVEDLGPGEVLGWSWLFAPFTWHLRARAVEPTKVIVINAAHLLRVAEDDHAFGYDIMKRVAQVIIHRLQAARRQLVAQAVESALHG